MSKALNINFSNEKLDLDYLVFNLPRFKTQMLKVAKIFHKYGFNSRTYNDDTEKYSTIFYEKTFTHWLTFTLENELWNKDNLSIHFKASNSRKTAGMLLEICGVKYFNKRLAIILISTKPFKFKEIQSTFKFSESKLVKFKFYLPHYF